MSKTVEERKKEIKSRMGDMVGVMNALEVDNRSVIIYFNQNGWTRATTEDKELMRALDKKAQSIYLRLEKQLKKLDQEVSVSSKRKIKSELQK